VIAAHDWSADGRKAYDAIAHSMCMQVMLNADAAAFLASQKK
jgi:hypothetical protein